MHTFLLLLAALASLCLVAFSYLAITSQLAVSVYVCISVSISIILLFLCEYFMQKYYYFKKSVKKSTASASKQAEELTALKAKIGSLEQELAAEKAKTATPAENKTQA